MAGFPWTRMVCGLCLILVPVPSATAADKNEEAEQLLLKAIAAGDLTEVEKIAVGLDLSKVTNFRLHVLSSPNADVVDFLREQEALNISDLQIWAIRGDAKAIKQFAASSEKAARMNELRRDYTGLTSYSPLMLAARNGRIAAARALIEAGADVNEWSHKHLTPLAVAAEGGHMEVVKDLLKAGAKVNAAPDDYTALMRACIGAQPEVVKVLLKAKADPKLKRHDGQTALHFAAKKGSAECIKLLLDRGVDVNALAYEKDTALHYAEIYEHKAAIEILKQAAERSKEDSKAN